MTTKTTFFKILTIAVFYLMASGCAVGQVEMEPWGNISGIRADGELMKIGSSLSVVKKDWSGIMSTRKESQRPKYIRKGKRQIVFTNIDSIYFTETVKDEGNAKAAITIQVKSTADVALQGIYFTVFLAGDDYSGGYARLGHSRSTPLGSSEKVLNQYFKVPARSVKFTSRKRQLNITLGKPALISLKSQGNKGLELFIPVETGDLKNGQSVEADFTIRVSGLVDRTPVNMELNTADTGRTFDGLGGNFRLQNSKTDPQVIDYCLKNLNVRWSRVEMPWQLWQPDISVDPVSEANSGRLNRHVQQSMEMAQRLFKMGIPVILSVWTAPDWAVVGKPKSRPGPDGVWGNPLDHTKTSEIDRSIASYLVYLKEKYGVEVSLFSFNESDLGINIRQTADEHAELIKDLGACFSARGLKTKMLLGDNSDATTYRFINSALNDPAARPYIGAVSFHSWRGWDRETLQKWADAATRLNLPLIVAEGSIDAQAWGYPAIFQEQSYALDEISLYIRLLSVCQPESILQWQLTADYSVLAGGGIFGDSSRLRPTRRFWNLKQFSATPKGLKAMALHFDAAGISAAALGDNKKGIYAIHLVNNGATRKVILKGIPSKIKFIRVFVTGKNRSMKEGRRIGVSGGQARFTLDQTSFTTLLAG